MSSAWKELRQTIQRSITQGVPVSFWWRDDDAVEPSIALDRLERLAARFSLRVHIAVVAARASQPLADRVAQSGNLVPLVHGWRHANHAPEGIKKSEFGTPRQEASAEITQAVGRLKNLFGDSLLPMFVPPWNRFDPCYLPVLESSGCRALSTFGARQNAHPHPGILQINTHIDPIDWRGTRDLAEVDNLLARLILMLEQRARGKLDASEPIGYLTHHLVHSEAIWAFSERLLGEILEAGAVIQPVKPLLEHPT